MRRAAATVALGAVLLLAGAAFAIGSLLVPGVALVALGLGAAAWVELARGAGVERRLGPATVEEGAPWPVELRVRSGRLPLLAAELRDPLLERPLAVRGRGRSVRAEVRFERRGRRRLAPARLLVRDPLGLAERRVSSAGGEVLVLPRMAAVVGAGLPGRPAGPVAEGGRSGAEGAEVDLDALRPYRPGAPAARIHWPTVARTGQMVERRLVAEADGWPLVVLDARDPQSAEALDRAVRAAGSLCLLLARRGGCAVLLPGDRRPSVVGPDLRAWPALHARLALVEAGPGGARADLLDRARAVLWVTAAVAGPGSAPPALARATTTERFLVALGAGEAPAFTVAGCSGWRLAARGGRAAA